MDIEFVQDSHSLSAEKGTVRGLHFQTPPFAQDKLVRVVRVVRVVRGMVFAVAGGPAPGLAHLRTACERRPVGRGMEPDLWCRPGRDRVSAWAGPRAQAAFRFLHVSTDEVYGSLGTTGVFTETTPYRSNSPYSASKAASDHFAQAWHRTFGLPIMISHCSNN